MRTRIPFGGVALALLLFTGCSSLPPEGMGPVPAPPDPIATNRPGSAPTAEGIDLAFGGAFGLSQSPGFDDPAKVLREAGYDNQTLPAPVRPAPRLWARAGSWHGIFLNLEFSAPWTRTLEVLDTTGINPKEVRFGVQVRRLAVLVEHAAGPLWLAAGPVLELGRADYRYEIVSLRPYVEEKSDPFGHVGGAIRSSLRIPLSEQIRAVGTVGYVFMPDVTVTEGVEATVGVSGWDAYLGLEWHP